MKPLFLFMLAAFSAAAQAVTPEEAVNYGKSMTLPTWESLSGNGAANGFIGSVSGDTETTQSLWAEGQGKLFAPGRTEADRCRNASDPTCLAVQVVDKTGTNPPTVNPDLTGGLIAGRDEVVNNTDKWADLGGNGAGGEDCRPIVLPVVPPAVTQTCDIRKGSPDAEKTCTETVTEIFERTSRWKCRVTADPERVETCVNPVVVQNKHTLTVTCWEGKTDGQTRSCPVVVTEYVKPVFNAVCLTPHFKKTVKTCRRKLTVKPAATCAAGDVTEVTVTDHAVLKEDSVPAMDTLTLTYTCADAKTPTVAMTVNAAAGPVSFSASGSAWDLVKDVAGNTARFEGELTCNVAACTAAVTLMVYRGTGESRVYQGKVTARLVFTKYVLLNEADFWDETCTKETA